MGELQVRRSLSLCEECTRVRPLLCYLKRSTSQGKSLGAIQDYLERSKITWSDPRLLLFPFYILQESRLKVALSIIYNRVIVSPTPVTQSPLINLFPPNGIITHMCHFLVSSQGRTPWFKPSFSVIAYYASIKRASMRAIEALDHAWNIPINQFRHYFPSWTMNRSDAQRQSKYDKWIGGVLNLYNIAERLSNTTLVVKEIHSVFSEDE